MGVGAVGAGIACIAISLFLFVLIFQGKFRHGVGRRGKSPIRMAALGLILGGGFIWRGLRLLRQGDVNTEGVVTEGQEPVPWRMIALTSTGMSLVLMAVVAWPLGFYDWLGNLGSGCRKLLTAEDLSALIGRSVDVSAPRGSALKCTADVVDENDQVLGRITVGGDMGGPQFENELHALERAGGAREEISGLGERAYFIQRSDAVVLAVAKGHAGATVSFAALPEASRAKLVEILKSRMAFLDAADAEWKRRYPGR
jgi:hypothetical protein